MDTDEHPLGVVPRDCVGHLCPSVSICGWSLRPLRSLAAIRVYSSSRSVSCVLRPWGSVASRSAVFHAAFADRQAHGPDRQAAQDQSTHPAQERDVWIQPGVDLRDVVGRHRRPSNPTPHFTPSFARSSMAWGGDWRGIWRGELKCSVFSVQCSVPTMRSADASRHSCPLVASDWRPFVPRDSRPLVPLRSVRSLAPTIPHCWRSSWSCS